MARQRKPAPQGATLLSAHISVGWPEPSPRIPPERLDTTDLLLRWIVLSRQIADLLQSTPISDSQLPVPVELWERHDELESLLTRRIPESAWAADRAGIDPSALLTYWRLRSHADDESYDAALNVLQRLELSALPPGRTEVENTPLIERVLAVLTPKQGRIMEYLWDRRTAGYAALETIPEAWRDVPSHEAITKQLKAIRTRLDSNNLSVVSIVVSEASKRVNLDRPAY